MKMGIPLIVARCCSIEKVMTKLTIALLLASSLLPGQTGPHENLNSTLWMQRSAEYRALAHQAYQAARTSLLTALREPNWTAALEQEPPFKDLPPAIILDLDETALDNSAYTVQQIAGTPHTEEAFQKFIERRESLAVPGAVEFLKFVRSHGVEVFYVTNRVCDPNVATDATMTVLRRLQFPVNSRRVFCKASVSDASDKGARRARIAAAHRILLLLGDDLNDFVSVPTVSGDWKARVSIRERYEEANRDNWGVRWFVIPNPTYGSWEKAIGFTVQEKRDALRP